jgi:hypothetical protein
VPNQEKVINQASYVTYHDNLRNMRMILLPNRELMQANFASTADNSFCTLPKQEWEDAAIQSGTVRESAPSGSSVLAPRPISAG